MPDGHHQDMRAKRDSLRHPGGTGQHHEWIQPGATIQSWRTQEMVPDGERIKAKLLSPSGHFCGDTMRHLIIQAGPGIRWQGQTEFHAPLLVVSIHSLGVRPYHTRKKSLTLALPGRENTSPRWETPRQHWARRSAWRDGSVWHV